MPNAPISFSFAGLPVSYCFTTPQRFALDIAAGLSGYLPGQFTTIIDSDSEPAVADRDKLWHKTVAGAPSGYIFKFFNGSWVASHPVEPSGDERRIFVGVESDIWAYDGGDGANPTTTPPTAATGAMWEKDAAFDFRMPLGAATSPAPNNTLVAVGGTGGEEKHSLTVPEIPPHGHLVGTEQGGVVVAEGMISLTGFAGINTVSVAGPSVGATVTSNTGGTTGVVVPHENMPPFIGVYFVKRTARIFVTA